MNELQKQYNAFFNDLAVNAIGKNIKCKNCGCDFFYHRFWYNKNKEQTECHGCSECTWFEPMGMKFESLLPLRSVSD